MKGKKHESQYFIFTGISAKEAGNYIGKTVTVVDTVNQVYKSKKGDYFLDIAGDYPDKVFIGVFS